MNYRKFNTLKNRARIDAALRSPVGRAIAMREVHLEMTSIGLRCMLVDDATEQRGLLSSLAFMLGIGAEVAAVVDVDCDNRAGLHQALAEVVDMACHGCLWRASWGAQFQTALEISGDLMLANSKLALMLLPGARELADDVAAGRIRPDAIEPLVLPDAYIGVETC